MPRSDGLALKLESDRMIYLDLLRVASSYLIILYHFQNQMDFGGAAAFVRARLEGLTLAVDLFFLISGFVISSVYTGRVSDGRAYGRYMGRRVARLLPLHWATFAVFAAFGILNATGHLPSNHPELYDARCALPNLLFLHSFGLCRSLTFNYVSWSISAEMGMYLVFPLLALVAVRRGVALLVIVAVAMLLTATSSGAGPSWLTWSFDLGVLRALPSFLLGMVAFRYREILAHLRWAAWWLLAASLLFVAGCLLQWPRLALLPVVYAVGVLGVAASERPSSRFARQVAPLGQLTYSLYMLHPLVQSVLLTGIGAGLLKLRGVPMNLFVVGTMALMLPIAWLSLVVFERPARHWLTRLPGMRRPVREGVMFTPDSRW